MSSVRIRIFIVVAAAVALAACEKKAAAPPAFGPADVSVVPVTRKDIPIYGDWVASLDGFVNANIQPQVSGYLVRQNYREGSFVHKGDVLFEIDARPFEAVLAQAKGQLAQAHGQLAQAQAQLELSEINVKRDTPLAQARAIAQSQLDTELQARAQNGALIETAKASIQSGEAAVQQADLNVGFTKVRSLIDGIAGIATTQIGNLVGPTTVLTAVSQLNPVKVYFPISEQEYMRVAGKIQQNGSSGSFDGNNPVPLRLTLASGDVYPHAGKIIFTDRQVDSQTGTIRIVGTFPNPGNILRPGQFARIQALTGTHKDALLVPQRAVSELQGRYLIATVGAGNKVAMKTVKMGQRIGDQWVVESGLEPTDQVISEGLSKIRDGSPVNPKPDTTAESSASAN